MIKQEQEQTILNINQKNKNIRNTCFSILEAILYYTPTLEKRSPSVFDSNPKNAYSSSILDKYDFEDLFRFCIKRLKIDDNLLVLIMMNIDKIIAKSHFIISNENINRLFYTCLMITKKYYEDNSFNNKAYSSLVGINCDDLLNMEIEFMKMIDFEFFIKDKEFHNYKQKISELYS